MDFIDYCDRHRILLAVFPPHSTHTLQPLDVVLFKPLSTAYSAELSTNLHTSQGLLAIKKGDFFPLFWRSWIATFKEDLILKSFEATGISPLNPDVVLKRFDHQSREGSSSSSDLSRSGWRKIDRLITSTVKDPASDEAKKVRRTLHSLQVQNELLNHEVKGLKEALNTKKKRQKKSKPLDLQQRQEYHGGAVFWSPRKVQEARARQVVRDRDEIDQQRQKDERARIRAANKLLKDQLIEEKRVARERREKEKAKLPAKLPAKPLAKPPARTTRLSQERKRPASKPPKQAIQRSIKRTRRVVGEVESKEAPGAALAAQPIKTRSSRVVRLPTRFE
jgi:hypothetical protein